MKIKIVKNLDEKKKRKKRKKTKPRAAYWWGYGLHDSDYGDAGDGGGGDGKRDDLSETIEQVGDKYVVKSKKGDREFGTYDTKKEAEKRLRQIEMFKHMKEEQLDEKKKKRKKKVKKKRDACYHKVKSRYKVWPSAYASGALVKCRNVGAENWGNKSKKKNEEIEFSIDDVVIENQNEAGTESSKEKHLGDWFGRKGAKGKKKGWVDCNAPDGKGGYKSCGRSEGEKRKKYPACRPTPGACKEKGKGKSWGKKASKQIKRKKKK